jgi:hypothetical protein
MKPVFLAVIRKRSLYAIKLLSMAYRSGLDLEN